MGAVAASLRRLDDEALGSLLEQCVADERKATATLLAVLAEFDVRRLYLPVGFSSLFDYCTRHLHLSERAAGSRIAVARLSRRLPIVLELIADSRVSLTVGSLLARHLNESNYVALLEEATHKTVSQVEVILARLDPQPDAKAIVRKLPQLPSMPESHPVPAPAFVPAAQSGSGLVPATPVQSRPPEILKPLAPERYKVQFTISEDTREKLRIPAAVQRAVWRRDKGRCAFIGSEGRCRERGGLELHHVKPFGAGGNATVDNIQLRCRAHNSLEMELYFDSRLGGE